MERPSRMRLPCILATLLLSSCSMSSWYPIIGSVAGGGAGAIAGPIGGAAGAGIGYAGGKTAQLFNENEELEATVTALTTGDVSALVEAGMAQHQTGFEEFTSYVKRILIIAACILGCYLSIPIFVARRTAETCSKTAAEKHLTRVPFPTNEKP